jgi:hypothetical protein
LKKDRFYLETQTEIFSLQPQTAIHPMKKTFTLAALAFSCLFVNAQNRGLYFDGSNDYVEALPNANNTNFSNAITIEAWINTTNANLPNQTIINRGMNDSYSIYLTSNKLSCIIGMYGYVQAAYTFSNSWHHVAAVYNGTNIQLYVDGNPVGTPAPLTGTVAVDNGYNLVLGMYPATVSSKFSGTMDEVRIWNVARTQAQLQANMNRELSTASNSNLKVYYRFNQGTASGSNAGQTTLVDAVGTSNATLYNFGLSGATSNFVGGYPSLIMLPLKLGPFTAAKQNSTIALSWSTYSEQNTASFEIERSSDNIRFQSIGSLPAAGNSNEEKRYVYQDAKPLPAASYYRLKMIDADGSATFSRVAMVKLEMGGQLSVYPNPASSVLHVTANGGEAGLTIRDASGRTVKEVLLKQTPGLVTDIDIQSLAKGIYFISAGEQTLSFIKE